jgi:hypothetical protein
LAAGAVATSAELVGATQQREASVGGIADPNPHQRGSAGGASPGVHPSGGAGGAPAGSRPSGTGGSTAEGSQRAIGVVGSGEGVPLGEGH